MKTAITDCWKSKVVRVVYSKLKAKCNRWQQPFLKSRKLAGQNSMKNRRMYIQTAKMVNNLETEQNCSTYSVVFKLVKRHHKPPVLLYFSGFSTLLAESLRSLLADPFNKIDLKGIDMERRGRQWEQLNCWSSELEKMAEILHAMRRRNNWTTSSKM